LSCFGVNSSLYDAAGNFLSRVGAVMLGPDGKLVCVTTISDATDVKPCVNGIELERYEYRRIYGECPDNTTRAVDFLGMYEVPKTLVTPDVIDSGTIWPREFAATNQMMFENVYDNLPLETQSPVGKVTQCHAAVIVERSAAPNQPTIATDALIVPLFNEMFRKDDYAGTALIDSAARHVGICIGRRIESQSGRIELLLAPVPQHSQDGEFQLWAPPGAHWVDLGFRAGAFASRVQKERTLDLGKVP